MGVPDDCIADAQYDPTDLTLLITFQHGGSYEYQFVPPDVYFGLLAGGGAYFNSNIREAFPAQRAGSSSPGLKILKFVVQVAIPEAL